MAKKPQKRSWIIGIDEVGRGPLAGPVTVCVVAMPLDAYKSAVWNGLTDSKKMTKKAREKWFALAQEMKLNGRILYSLQSRTARMIDTKGMSVCIKDCIEKGLQELCIDPKDARVLLDGALKAPLTYTDQETVIKGDSVHKIISLASVIAKVSRDAYMTKLARKHPGYGWERNMGYGTLEHRRVLKTYGASRFHRMSFLLRILKK